MITVHSPNTASHQLVLTEITKDASIKQDSAIFVFHFIVFYFSNHYWDWICQGEMEQEVQPQWAVSCRTAGDRLQISNSSARYNSHYCFWALLLPLKATRAVCSMKSDQAAIDFVGLHYQNYLNLIPSVVISTSLLLYWISDKAAA